MEAERARSKRVCYCINLRRINGAVTEYYDRILQPSGLTVSQFSLLKNLERMGESSVSELAKEVELERSTLARSLKPLFAAGYVEDVSQTKARNSRIRVTESGAEVLARAVPLWLEAQEGILGAIGADGVEMLEVLQARFARLSLFIRNDAYTRKYNK